MLGDGGHPVIRRFARSFRILVLGGHPDPFFGSTPSVFLDTQAYTLVERLCAFWTQSIDIACSIWPGGIEESGLLGNLEPAVLIL